MKRFPKSCRLRTRGQYQRLLRYGRRLAGKWIVIESCANTFGAVRLGITVSKKYGTSPERNRFKRIAREGFRLCRERLAGGWDLNVRPRPCAKQAKMSDILADFLFLFGEEERS